MAAAAWSCAARAQEAASRLIPSRILPVPDTVSPALQKLLGQPLSLPPNFPKTADEWKALVAAPPDLAQRLVEAKEKFGVTVVAQVLGGVRCYAVTPKGSKPSTATAFFSACTQVAGCSGAAMPHWTSPW